MNRGVFNHQTEFSELNCYIHGGNAAAPKRICSSDHLKVNRTLFANLLMLGFFTSSFLFFFFQEKNISYLSIVLANCSFKCLLFRSYGRGDIAYGTQNTFAVLGP